MRQAQTGISSLLTEPTVDVVAEIADRPADSGRPPPADLGDFHVVDPFVGQLGSQGRASKPVGIKRDRTDHAGSIRHLNDAQPDPIHRRLRRGDRGKPTPVLSPAGHQRWPSLPASMWPAISA